jgi:hypothetical protein
VSFLFHPIGTADAPSQIIFHSVIAAPLILKSWALNRVDRQIWLKFVSLAEMKEEAGSVITQRSRDCLGCRLVSGGGLLGVGVYISYQSKRANNLTFKIIMNTIALGIRLFCVVLSFNT